MWHVVQIAVVIGHSNPRLCIFAIWWVAGWQRSIRRPPHPKDGDRNDVDKHRDDDDDGDNHRGFGRNELRRDRRGRLLPVNVLQHNDSVCGGIDGIVANTGRADFCWRPQREPWENGRSGGGNGGAWGHLRTLPPTSESVELISDTIWGGETGEVAEVSDGLYSVFWSSYLSELGRPGPTPRLPPTICSWCVCVCASLSDQSYYI